MTQPEFIAMCLREDVEDLDDLKDQWLLLTMLSIVSDDVPEKDFSKRLAATADEMIGKREARLVRKYL